MKVGEYRLKAAELIAKAKREKDPELAAELENLARSFLRLAEQAELNRRFNTASETPSKEDGDA